MSNYAAWQVDTGNFPRNSILRDQIAFVCRYGLLAPSVHNTQPWRFEVAHEELCLSLDQNRLLTHGDPTTREAHISLGACLENILLAAEDLGLETKVSHGGSDASHDGVKVQFKFSKGVPKSNWLHAITARRQNRALFNQLPIEKNILDSIEHSWKSPNTLIRVVSDPQLIKIVAELSSRSIGMALTIPDFRHELANQIRRNRTTLPDGMTAKTLKPGKLSLPLSSLARRHKSVAFRDAGYEFKKMMSASALILVFTRGDTVDFWLEAGRAYERTILEATRHSLAHSTSAAAIEAPDFHQEIEHYCKTQFRLQAITRIGYSKIQPPHSPRRNLEDVLTFS